MAGAVAGAWLEVAQQQIQRVGRQGPLPSESLSDGSVPPELDRLTAELLSTTPSDRPGSAAEVDYQAGSPRSSSSASSAGSGLAK